MYSPVSDHASVFFGTSSSTINNLSIEALVLYIVVAPIAAYYLKTRGIRANVIGAAALNAIGAIIKFLGALSSLCCNFSLPPQSHH